MFGINIPDPLGDLLQHGLAKELQKDALSSSYSAIITGLWYTKPSRIGSWFGFGPTQEQAIATSLYLALLPMQEKGQINLRVPKALLADKNLKRFGSMPIAEPELQGAG